jgi:phosphoglycolate phosphatase
MRGPAQAILFDLDGTLADTGPDLAFALNETLRAYGKEPLPYEKIRPVVSHGGMALIKLGFGLDPASAAFEQRRQHLLRIYADNLCRETSLFPAMAEVLELLEENAIPWGIVTNKPAWLTDPLIEAMALHERAGCVVSGDTCPERKPHPQPILHACSLIGRAPDDTWYIGDAGRDMQAGRAAGCTTVAALYGYIHPDDPPEHWESDLTIDGPEQLLDLLRNDRSHLAQQ